MSNEDELIKTIKKQGELIGWLIREITVLTERVSVLYADFHDIAPEKTLIDLVARDERERLDMIARYMNHGYVPELFLREQP